MTGTVETKSTRAPRKMKYSRGVCYDRRIKKFVASITIKGRRIYLGAYEDEDDAASAHALARHDNPIRRGGPGGCESFEQAYDAFLDEQPPGLLKGGTVFVAPNKQRYVMIKAETILHPTIDGPHWAYYRWLSNCSECDAEFVTSTKSSKKHITGMTRTCAQHRKGGARGDEPQAHVALLRSVKANRKRRDDAEQQEAEDEFNKSMSAQLHGLEELAIWADERKHPGITAEIAKLIETLGRDLTEDEFYEIQDKFRKSAKDLV